MSRIDMFYPLPYQLARLGRSVATLTGERRTPTIYFITLLIMSMSGSGSTGSLAKCGRGPIRDFRDFGTTYTDIHCVFHDVCWHRDGLLFNLTESQISGPWPIIISGSSVPLHDGMNIDITPVTTQTLKKILASSNVEYINNAILLRRFLPNNLFHVLHDDIMPVYALKESLPWPNLTLFATEDTKHRFDDYYALLRLPTDYAQPGTVKCFHKLFAGLPKVTLWYQYGFRSPQSILHGTDVSIVRKFVDEVNLTGKMGAERRCTILTRELNRRILNLDEIEIFLAEEHHCSVERVSLDTNFMELREVLSATDLLVSMHGAELSLIILLPSSALVIELFPYAIKSSNYAPYRRLCELLGLIYEPWENEFETNNNAFPEKWLSGLPADKRLRISNARTVEPHLCCTDAAWLYRIYQDTKIDLDSFRKVLRKAITRRLSHLSCSQVSYFELLTETKRTVPEENRIDSVSIRDWRSFWNYIDRRGMHREPVFYPGRVRNVRCSRGSNHSRVVTWRAPINYRDAPEQKQSYYDIISQCGSETLMTRTRKSSFISPPCQESVAVWVQAHGGIKATYPTICEL